MNPVMLQIFVCWSLIHAINLVTSQTTLTCEYRSSCSNTMCVDEGGLVLCTCVNGAGAIATTVWSGTAFNCPSSDTSVNNQITLPHIMPYSSVTDTCGSNIVAQGGNASGAFYTSVLTVNTTLELNQRTVGCSVSGVQDFNFLTLTVSGAPIHVTARATVSFEVDGLFIEWTDISNGFVYDIIVESSDNPIACGQSQRIGAAKWHFTGLQPSQRQMCYFSVKTINRCGCHSNPSPPTCVLIQVPDVVQIDVKNLLYFNNTLSTVEASISNQMNEAENCVQDPPQMNTYTFGGGSCAPVSYETCRENTCRYVLPVKLNGCTNFTEVQLTATTSNAFGESTSLPLPISYRNSQFTVMASVIGDDVIVYCTVSCRVNASCTLRYSPEGQFQNSQTVRNQKTSNCGGFVTQSILLSNLEPNIYFYNLIVSIDGTFVPVTAQGTFQITNQDNSESTTLGTAVAITTILTSVIFLSIGVTIGSLCMNCLAKRKASANTQLQQQQGQEQQQQEMPLQVTMYEEVLESRSSERIDMEKNLAYGPVKHGGI